MRYPSGILPASMLLIVSACDNQGDEHSLGTPASKLFAQYCSACHGDRGQGIFIKGAPPLNETELSAQQIARLIVKGSEGHKMPEFPKMNARDAAAVAGYVVRLPAAKP